MDVDHVDPYVLSLGVDVGVVDIDIPTAYRFRPEGGGGGTTVMGFAKTRKRRYRVDVTWDHRSRDEAGKESVLSQMQFMVTSNVTC